MRGTSSFRPPPIDCPTRMAPALASAKDGMKATDESWMTLMKAATALVPSPATTTLVKNRKARNSRNQFSPEGSPTRRSLPSSRVRSRPMAAPSPPRVKTTSKPRKARLVERALASAAPRTPSAGRPRCPSMRSQFPSTLSSMAATCASMGSRVLPSPP